MAQPVLEWLQERGLIHDVSDAAQLGKTLGSQSIRFYCGFDPTADSLHVGSMLPLMVMRKLQQFGHTPIVLLGSATGMIGDPSGKSEERKLLTADVIQRNLEGIRNQAQLFLTADGPNGYEMVENGSWINSLTLIEFLRDTGKHFSVNAMLGKESVRHRLEQREQGISYTEFSYMLLQAYDFYWLRKERDCKLQVGGSDQWGNITAGIDLIRRRLPNADAFGMTFPLLTTASGGKFGKTERGAVWLDPAKSSPFRFYQFWLNTADADVGRCLRLFTDLPLKEIEELEREQSAHPERRSAQRHLATTLTSLIHGSAGLEKAAGASEVLFGANVTGVPVETLLEIFADVPSVTLNQSDLNGSFSICDLLVRCGAATSKSAARRLVESGGVTLNDEKIRDFSLAISSSHFLDGAVAIIRSGKKNYFLARLEG